MAICPALACAVSNAPQDAVTIELGPPNSKLTLGCFILTAVGKGFINAPPMGRSRLMTCERRWCWLAIDSEYLN